MAYRVACTRLKKKKMKLISHAVEDFRMVASEKSVQNKGVAIDIYINWYRKVASGLQLTMTTATTLATAMAAA